MTLNVGQQKVFREIQEFLASKHQFFSLESGGGYGKTYLLNHLETQIPELNQIRELLHLPTLGSMVYTATTNKAASLLGNNSQTIFKQFRIRPHTNYKTNTTTYQVGDSDPLGNKILVVDEASMFAPDVFQLVWDKLCPTTKVIFALDPYQLAPIGHEKPIVNTMDIPRGELTEPMRQKVDSHLFKMCELMREAVRIQEYIPLVQGEGVRFVDGATFQAEYLAAFKNHEDVRILVHSNDQVELHNTHVRKTLYGNSKFQVGDPVLAAASLSTCNDVRVEECYTITDISEEKKGEYFPYYDVAIGIGQYFKIPVDKNDYFRKLKIAQKHGKQTGDWTVYFALKNNYLDIRDAFACTVHKAQGSTYDKVFLDFANLSSCFDLNTFLRALYVVISRARTEVVIFGL